MAIANLTLFNVVTKALSSHVQQVRQNHSGEFTESLLDLPFTLTSVRNKTKEKKKALSATFVFLKCHSYQKEGYGEILFWIPGLALVLLCANEDSQNYLKRP